MHPVEEGKMRRLELRLSPHVAEEHEQEHGRGARDALPVHGADKQGMKSTTLRLRFRLEDCELSEVAPFNTR